MQYPKDKQKILAQTLFHLEKLVAIETTSNLSNLELIEYLESVLKPLSYRCQRIYNSEKTKANLWASIGKKDRAGVVLSGHTDTVSTAGQEWSSNPYQMVKKDGLLYGRGTVDMKGFLALMLSFAPYFEESKIPIHLCFSYDEEVGCLGIQHLIKNFSEVCPITPKFCFIGEPTELQPVIAHKGKISFELLVQGLECHSAYLDDGVNAISYTKKIPPFFEKMGEQARLEKELDKEFSVPFSSFHIGYIQGGSNLNIVPKNCKTLFEIRPITQEKSIEYKNKILDFVKQLDKELKTKNSSCFAKINFHSYPCFSVEKESEIVRLAQQWSGFQTYSKENYTTEASAFQLADIPTIVIGPGKVEQAHKPDEFIELSQLEKGITFLQNFCDYFAKNEG